MTIASGSTNRGRIFFADGTVGSEQYAGFIVYDHSTNSMLFGTGNGGTQDITIDSSGRLGVGTSSPTEKIDVNGTVKATAFSGSGASLTNVNAATLASISSTQFLRSDAADQATQRIQFSANATNGWNTIATGSGSQGCIEIYNGGVGNDAFMTFHVGGDFACYFGLDGGINDLAVGGWSFGANSYRIWHQGNDGAGSGLDADTLDGIQGSNFLRSDTSDTMNGNLTVTNDLTAGESFFGAASYKVRINSTSSTGILEFNSTNGIIGNAGAVLGLSANSTQIVDVRAAAMQPTTDNVTDLGASTKRWDNIYATNGTIQTSDGAEKQDVEALSDAELRVAQSIKGLIRKFRFKSAVAEKGDDARIHFGVIAQDVRAAFEAEGLDAGQYGCFCADVDEDGNQRLGIRYDELLAFVIAVL
jgi:hypothetical protein